ncbi:TPA: hypothetical protein ACGF1S_003734 [Vibrio cholerae]
MYSVATSNGAPVDLFSTTFPASSYARMLFQRVLNASGYIGIVNFCASYQVPNALAASRPIYLPNGVISHYERFIIYNPNFMKNMEFWSSNEFVPLAILAHELGHHFFAHTDNINSIVKHPWAKEIEADYYSGFVLAKLGAKPSDLELSQRLMFTMWANATHPDSYSRISNIARGWKDGGGMGIVEDVLQNVYNKINNELNRWH